jgi:hypothetical protein
MKTTSGKTKTTKYGRVLYPVQRGDETRYVSIPGSDETQPGPDNVEAFERFLLEATSSYAETSDLARPGLQTFEEARAHTPNRQKRIQLVGSGLVVRFGEHEFEVAITKSSRRTTR